LALTQHSPAAAASSGPHSHERLLTAENIRYQLRQELDNAWTLRLGPVAAAEVGAAVAAFIGDGL